MNTRVDLSFVVLIFSLTACGTDDSTMTRHQVCDRLASATCERLAACEPLVAQSGCTAREMARCCPDGVCSEAVIADEERLSACENAVATMSCTALTDGNLPASCEDLTDPVPEMTPDAGAPPGDGGPTADEGILEVNWAIYAAGASLACSQFLEAQTIRIIATPPVGAAITRDFTCIDFSGLTTMPVGVYSVLAQARSANGTVVQQTTASTVGVAAGGSSTSFTFTVSTSLGSYCSQLANAVCNACAPADASCNTDLISECCGADGICGRPALADPQQFSSCLSAFGSGSYCSDAAPAVCQGAVDVF